MLRFLALLFLLVPSVAKSQEMNKADMITEFADMATLIAAEVLKCGETNKKRVLSFNAMFDSFMLYTAEQEGVELTQQDVEAYKIGVLMQQYQGMLQTYPSQGCDGINRIIHMYDDSLHYAESVYDYYQPLDTL
tara:strand:- start:1052 stop:1453 length:402 start_codon:yes stop_codon:yes gene_type:complete